MTPTEKYTHEIELNKQMVRASAGLVLAGSGLSVSFELLRHRHYKAAATAFGISLVSAAVGSSSFENAMDLSRYDGVMAGTSRLTIVNVPSSSSETTTREIFETETEAASVQRRPIDDTYM